MNFKVTGLNKVKKLIEDLQERASPEKLGEEIHKFTNPKLESLHDTEGSSEGVAWKPTKEPDESDGRLKDSVSNPSNSEHVYRVNGRVIQVGTSTPYAVYQHLGTKWMPARKVVYLSSQSQKELAGKLAKFIANGKE